MLLFLALAAVASVAAQKPRDCSSPTSAGCRKPDWPVSYAMRASLYTYCYEHCPLAFFANNTHLGTFAGVVGVDHYHTQQGMPCINGRPQEFEMQDAFAIATKKAFPGTRVLLYRITGAVPYAGIVHDLMLSNPEYFVRWHNPPNNNGSICRAWVARYLPSVRPLPPHLPPHTLPHAVMPYAEHGTGRPGDNCDWPIIAAAYDFSNPVVRTWFQTNIIAPAMVHGDGVWLDGDGPDNGSWMCSGNYQWGHLPAPYPALNAAEVNAFCDGENAAQEAAHDYIYAHGGHEGQACWEYVRDFPVPADSPAQCAAKLLSISARNFTLAVGFAMDRTGGQGYTDATAAQTIAAFLLTRGEQWFFGVTQTSDTINATVAALLLSDYGQPMGAMANRSALLFTRSFERATVALDCSTFTASFVPV
jgi:hypothetical protein